MKAIYIADDGKQFDNEHDCREYERSTEYGKMNGLIGGLDFKKRKIYYSDKAFCEEAMVVYLVNQKAMDAFNDRCNEEGICCDDIDKPGVYLWDRECLVSREEGWVDMHEAIKQLREKEAELADMITAALPDNKT